MPSHGKVGQKGQFYLCINHSVNSYICMDMNSFENQLHKSACLIKRKLHAFAIFPFESMDPLFTTVATDTISGLYILIPSFNKVHCTNIQSLSWAYVLS